MVGPKYTRELPFPYTLRLVESGTQGLEDDFVSYLCLSVGLRMSDKGD